MSRRAVLALWLLAALLAVMTLAASGVGALRLPVSLLWSGSDDALRQIWLTIRLPRVLLALALVPAFIGESHFNDDGGVSRRAGRDIRHFPAQPAA